MDLAAKRGYRPGSVGRALSRNETRTVGLIVPNILNPFSRNWLTPRKLRRAVAVVMEAAAAAGIAVPKRNVPIDDFTVEGGAPAFHELHKRGLPLTIVSLNNRMAEGVHEMMLMLGVTMGDDVSLASFDEFAFFRLVRPSITAVVQPIAQMAAVAFDFLIRRMGGERAESVLLEAGLAIPASTPGRSGTTPTP